MDDTLAGAFVRAEGATLHLRLLRGEVGRVGRTLTKATTNTGKRSE